MSVFSPTARAVVFACAVVYSLGGDAVSARQISRDDAAPVPTASPTRAIADARARSAAISPAADWMLPSTGLDLLAYRPVARRLAGADSWPNRSTWTGSRRDTVTLIDAAHTSPTVDGARTHSAARGDVWARAAGASPVTAATTAQPVQPRVDAAVRTSVSMTTTQYGVATWYGPGYEGQMTACGSIYRSAEFTAASNTLPCGTLATVTREDTGASVTVTITDRGAFRYPIIIDLSAAAFSTLAHQDDGVVPVVVTVE